MRVVALGVISVVDQFKFFDIASLVLIEVGTSGVDHHTSSAGLRESGVLITKFLDGSKLLFFAHSHNQMNIPAQNRRPLSHTESYQIYTKLHYDWIDASNKQQLSIQRRRGATGGSGGNCDLILLALALLNCGVLSLRGLLCL